MADISLYSEAIKQLTHELGAARGEARRCAAEVERLTAELEEARASLAHIYDVTYYKNVHPEMDVERMAHYVNQKSLEALKGHE